MTSTFTGIQNENEFYSHHYLAEIFAKDIQATITGWREDAAEGGEGQRSPDQALRALARPYLQFRQRFGRERRHHERVQLQRGWFSQVLSVLGYRFSPANYILDGASGDDIPALCTLDSPNGTTRLLVLGAFDPADADEDPLSLRPHPAQFHGEAPPPEALLDESWNDIITRRIFGQYRPPRWVILLAPGPGLSKSPGPVGSGEAERWVRRGCVAVAEGSPVGPGRWGGVERVCSGVWVGAWALSRRGAHGDAAARPGGAPSGVRGVPGQGGAGVRMASSASCGRAA